MVRAEMSFFFFRNHGDGESQGLAYRSMFALTLCCSIIELSIDGIDEPKGRHFYIAAHLLLIQTPKVAILHERR